MISTAAATAAQPSTGTSSVAAPSAAAIPQRMIAISFFVTDSTSSGRQRRCARRPRPYPITSGTSRGCSAEAATAPTSPARHHPIA